MTGSSYVASQHLITTFNDNFELKDLGSLHYFLGIEVVFHDDVLHLNQRKYIVELLEKCGMLDTKSYGTPMVIGRHISKNDGIILADATQFKSTMGSLQYCLLTRPDIAFSVNKLFQFLVALQMYIGWLLNEFLGT